MLYLFTFNMLQRVRQEVFDTGCGFEPWYTLNFLHFIPKIIPKFILKKNQNQLRVMSVLSHTGGADLGVPGLFLYW